MATMTIQQYQTLTGITVPTSEIDFVTAQIAKAQRILESMLGFTLDEATYDDNEYVEIGKTNDSCPCSILNPDVELEDPDEVILAYRLYNYNSSDLYLSIDPATAVHAVKLVKDGITHKTLDPDEYRIHYERGIAKYIEQCDRWCACRYPCDCVQLAVDADWVWDVEEDLLDVWADMVTYYADCKKDVKSESLGTHSYTKFDRNTPEFMSYNLSVIKRYAGPHGSVKTTVTL